MQSDYGNSSKSNGWSIEEACPEEIQVHADKYDSFTKSSIIDQEIFSLLRRVADCLPSVVMISYRADMDMLAHCRAMAAFCRQHAQFENEDASFWIEEAKEWDNLMVEYSIRQSPVRTGQTGKGDDPFMKASHAS